MGGTKGACALDDLGIPCADTWGVDLGGNMGGGRADSVTGGRTMNDLPSVALSIRQPWAWLIVNGYKDVENRSWRTNFRGRFLVHAAQKMTTIDWENAEWWAWNVGNGIRLPKKSYLVRGAIIGESEISECLPWFSSKSGWHEQNQWGFYLVNSKPLVPIPCRGALSFFRPKLSGVLGGAM